MISPQQIKPNPHLPAANDLAASLTERAIYGGKLRPAPNRGSWKGCAEQAKETGAAVSLHFGGFRSCREIR
jgi:hypothetical protein